MDARTADVVGRRRRRRSAVAAVWALAASTLAGCELATLPEPQPPTVWVYSTEVGGLVIIPGGRMLAV